MTATLTVGGVSAPYTVTTKAAVPTGGGGGGGGGGGSSTSVDFCPNGDLSPSTTDGRCNRAMNNFPFTGSFMIPNIIMNRSMVRFRDIAMNWAEADIIRLVTRGIIDNVISYQPDASLTRAEFLKIVINSTGWDLPTTTGTGLDIPFNDVSLTVWYAQYVSLARSK
ncbi:MAG: S-layer homology domain-containing protein [Patescibacteria group bacterium]